MEKHIKVTSIYCEQTRQIRSYEPLKYGITAEILEGHDPLDAAKELHSLTLKVLFRDDIKQRDHLIATLVDVQPKQPAPAKLPGEKSNLQSPNF